MLRFVEVIKAIQQGLHVLKPLLFEMVLFLWAVIEMGKFIWSIALGGHAG